MSTFRYVLDNLPVIMSATARHLELVAIALVAAVLTAVPLGIYITRKQALADIVLYIAGVVMTIPSVALLGFLIPVLAIIGQGIGPLPAIVALFLYAQLPIIRNTYTAIRSVDPAIIEAAVGIGMTPRQVLWRIQVPLALRLHGVRDRRSHRGVRAREPRRRQAVLPRVQPGTRGPQGSAG